MVSGITLMRFPMTLQRHLTRMVMVLGVTLTNSLKILQSGRIQIRTESAITLMRFPMTQENG